MHNVNQRGRLFAGVGALLLAAVVGLVGYLKLSLEPNVNRQIPFLASAGMAVVILSAVGGAFLVAEQLRSDGGRLEAMEDALRDLSAQLSTSIEDPARRGSVEVPTRVLGQVVDDQPAPQGAAATAPPAEETAFAAGPGAGRRRAKAASRG